jgi:hypothetical protein
MCLLIVASAAADYAMAASGLPPGVVNSITLTNPSGAAIRNYPFQFGRPFLDGAVVNAPQVLINGSAVASQADVKNRYPDGSVAYAVIAVVIPTIPAGGSLTLTFQNQTTPNNTPLTQTQMLAMRYMFSAQMILAGTAGGASQAVDARTMLANGDYKLWTAGPVAQTIILADDSPARKYDIGLGDGYHPLRPRFYATFWPATSQVSVRVVGENDNIQEIEDLSYNLTLTAANAVPYRKSGVQHWAMSGWTRAFWLGGTPNPEVNIDNNLAYLESTRFIPNYDPALVVPESAIEQEYSMWTGGLHDIYDGQWDGGLWEDDMGATAARQDIGPYPTWSVMWLYTGDWRLRQMALGMADLAAAWPAHLRETVPTNNLLRTDAPNAGTAFGLPVSIISRPRLNTSDLTGLTIVGPYNQSQPWQYSNAHEPSPFYPQYILTGDPYYLSELTFWAAYDAAQFTPGDCAWCRSYDGTYGGINGQVRGDAWVTRSRAEAAFAQPDSSPEKTYLVALTNDAIAKWEGQYNVTGTPFDGTPLKNWAHGQQPNPPPASMPAWGAGCTVPTCAGQPAGYYAEGEGIAGFAQGDLIGVAGVAGYENSWQQWYLNYALGRAVELGFAFKPLLAYTLPFEIGMVNSAAPMLVSDYATDLLYSTGPGTAAYYTDWPTLLASIDHTFLTGNVPGYFNGHLLPDSYSSYAMAGMPGAVDNGLSGAAAAWTWLKSNVHDAIGNAQFATDPAWDIVPHTDTNTLPLQPTSPL